MVYQIFEKTWDKGYRAYFEVGFLKKQQQNVTNLVKMIQRSWGGANILALKTVKRILS